MPQKTIRHISQYEEILPRYSVKGVSLSLRVKEALDTLGSYRAPDLNEDS